MPSLYTLFVSDDVSHYEQYRYGDVYVDQIIRVTIGVTSFPDSISPTPPEKLVYLVNQLT